MKKMLHWAGIFVVLNLCACTYDRVEVNPCDNLPINRNISFREDVTPILKAACAIEKCHVNGSRMGDWNSYYDVKKRAESGLLEYKITSGEMPRYNTLGPKTLTACEIELITKWIKQGAINN